MIENISIPRGDYRAYPFAIELGNALMDLSGYTFVFICKKNLTDKDVDAKFTKTVIIPASGIPVYSGLLEIESADSDHIPGIYKLIGMCYTENTKPMTAQPVEFEITERGIEEVPEVIS